MVTWFQPPAVCRVTNHHSRLPRATSSLGCIVSHVFVIYCFLFWVGCSRTVLAEVVSSTEQLAEQFHSWDGLRSPRRAVLSVCSVLHVSHALPICTHP